MRTKALTLAGVLMTIGLAILGWVNPTLGVVCLFGGAATWIVCQKKTISIIERVIASKSRRQVLDEESAKKQHAREQFLGLSASEKEAVKYVKLNGHILPQQVASYLASRGFADADGIIDKVRSKTPFLLGSFSGEFSINPELKEPLDELLNPPLLNPTVRGVALAVVVIAVVGCGFLFRKYVHPGEARTSTLAEPGTSTSSPTPSAIPTKADNGPAPQNATTQEAHGTQKQSRAMKKDSSKTASEITKPAAQVLPAQPQQQECAPAAYCAQSSGQSGGITAGAVIVKTPPLEIKWTSGNAVPDKPEEFPYQQHVTVSVNTLYSPVSLAIICDSEIDYVSPYGATMQLRSGISDKHIGFLKYSSPALMPGEPLVIGIAAKHPFVVKDVVQANIP